MVDITDLCKQITQMRLAGCYGLMIDDWDSVEVGQYITVNGKEFMVSDKQSFPMWLDGKYSGRPAWIQLRGFNPGTDL